MSVPFRSRLRPFRRKLRILFSRREDWEPLLRDAFRHTPHRVAFDAFTPANLAGHDLTVPLTIADLKFLCSDQPGYFGVLPMPSLRSVDVCDDKLLFNRTLADAGLGRYAPQVSDQPFYPYIVKRRIDESGAHSHIVGSWAQERGLAAECHGQDYFRQALVPGNREYATHIVFDRGRIRYALTVEYLFSGDIYVKGRDRSTWAAAIPNPGCMGVFATILRTLEFQGLCCVNYKLVDGIPSIFEINPRFGHSLCPYFPRMLEALRKRWWKPLAPRFARRSPAPDAP